MEPFPNVGNLGQKAQDILRRHYKETTVTSGETGHLMPPKTAEVAPSPAPAIKKKPEKKFVSFLVQSLQPGDRE